MRRRKKGKKEGKEEREEESRCMCMHAYAPANMGGVVSDGYMKMKMCVSEVSDAGMSGLEKHLGYRSYTNE